MTKKQAQQELDRLRKDKRSFRRGMPQYERRLHLETILDQHLYEKEVQYDGD